MNLTETPDLVTWPETPCGYVEKVGPFQNTAMAAWQELLRIVPTLQEQSKITHRFFARYRIESSVYRACVGLSAAFTEPPSSLRSETFKGGNYSRFVLKGPYSQLGEATGRVLEIVKTSGLKVRDDYFIESYVNDPKTIPESELLTEILIPRL